ncbi:MAG TPA: cation:proton antiporter [Candidatus Acidoferrales bacterium]|nr:cation:proton antiporter [Candidatus Acidoferrales bacterium]
MAETILVIGLIIFLAHFFVALFRKTRVPDVLWLTLLGLLLGPITHEVAPESFGKAGSVISTIALVLILFESGMTLDPLVIPSIWRPVLRLTLSTLIVTIGLTMVVGVFWLKLDPMLAAMLGSVLGGTSAAVVIALVKSIGMKDPPGTILILESALGDVLTIILLLGLLDAAKTGALNPVHLAGSIIASLLCAGIIGVLGGAVWLSIMNRVRSFPNTAFTTLALAFVLYGLTDTMGFSGAVAALAFGATLTNHDLLGIRKLPLLRGREFGVLAHFDHEFLNEMLFLLKVFFFIYLGISIRFAEGWLALAAFVLILLVYVARIFTVKLVTRLVDIEWPEAGLMSVLAPKGLVSAVLASIPVARGIEGAERARDFAYLAVIVSILMTAILIPLVERNPVNQFYQRLYGKSQNQP